ncbi:arabinan endo-1,5-alpha-L-arabinosidase [Alloacidobacterium dinghuense]|uniref:Arabinan endo-1,5-alpha-L-arabinosidase n=1 Tax=Alloacidobacterium dinghuense TaxID=2763107 RepID=A0A7G8BME6_9BACT|nr:arabinan endo-1,5-alpha-L-arabinosidase [Alloacidobacterium dinghuense]QNI33716.1 arabinan endo-1,5-alpha-L-arabinosidase [Alloacidobacterium dinghuense]
MNQAIKVLLVALLSLPLLCTAQQPQALTLTGDYEGTHDPSIMKEGKTWYVFATGKTPDGGQFQIRCSENLTDWKLCGHVFDQIPDWIHKDSPGTVDLWAPDISYENGEYRIYYAYSLFGKNTSGIALATNKTLDRFSPDYKWVDHGLVLRSVESDDFNAIDPNFVLDAQGHAWLAFGSFWSGIKMRCLDEKTGLLSKEDTHLYSLASRSKPADAAPAKPGLPPDWEAVEAPFIVRHGDYYYLFVSWDLCCRGTKSTYRTMVGRAKKITGPYLDKQSKSMAEGAGSELLSGNTRWLGPGGESVWMQPDDHDLLVFHAYDAKAGKPALQISTIVWRDGWPRAALQQ